MVAAFAFFGVGLHMAVVQGFIEGNILPGGGDGRIFLVAPAAGLWPAFLVRSGQLTVAGDAIDMVGVCHRLSVRIGQSFELGRQASLFIGHVAGTAVPIDFCQRLGVAAVEKSHRRPFQRPHGLHGVDDDQVRTAFKGPSATAFHFHGPCGKQKNHDDGQQHATCFQMNCSFPHR
jgi:hypothetical protein